MDFFEFILIITSVIYALCMAPLLSGFVRLLQFDGEIRHFLPQAVFSLYLFILVPMLWWTIWFLRDADWQFATYLYVIIEPAILFIACSLIFPQRLDGHSYSLEDHYHKIRVPLLTSLFIMSVLAFADGVVIGAEAIWHERRYIQILSLVVLAWALIDRRNIAQYAVAFTGLFTSGALMVIWFWLPPG